MDENLKAEKKEPEKLGDKVRDPYHHGKEFRTEAYDFTDYKKREYYNPTEELLNRYETETTRIDRKLVRYRELSDKNSKSMNIIMQLSSYRSAGKRADYASKTVVSYSKYRDKRTEITNYEKKYGEFRHAEPRYQEEIFKMKYEALLIRLEGMITGIKTEADSRKCEKDTIYTAQVSIYSALIRLCERTIIESASDNLKEKAADYQKKIEEKLDKLIADHEKKERRRAHGAQGLGSVPIMKKINAPTKDKKDWTDNDKALESIYSDKIAQNIVKLTPNHEHRAYYEQFIEHEEDPKNIRGKIDFYKVKTNTENDKVVFSYRDEDNMELKNLKHPRRQETNACFAYSLSMMLRSLGYEYDPSLIRRYIPENATTMNAVKYYYLQNTTGTGNILEMKDIYKHFNAVDKKNGVFDLSKNHHLVSTRFNTEGMGPRAYNAKDKDAFASAIRQEEQEDAFTDEIRCALKNHSAASVLLGITSDTGHYINITGIKKVNGTMLYLVQDSLRSKPAGEWHTFKDILSYGKISDIEYIVDEKKETYCEQSPDYLLKARKKYIREKIDAVTNRMTDLKRTKTVPDKLEKLKKMLDQYTEEKEYLKGLDPETLPDAFPDASQSLGEYICKRDEAYTKAKQDYLTIEDKQSIIRDSYSIGNDA